MSKRKIVFVCDMLNHKCTIPCNLTFTDPGWLSSVAQPLHCPFYKDFNASWRRVDGTVMDSKQKN